MLKKSILCLILAPVAVSTVYAMSANQLEEKLLTRASAKGQITKVNTYKNEDCGSLGCNFAGKWEGTCDSNDDTLTLSIATYTWNLDGINDDKISIDEEGHLSEAHSLNYPKMEISNSAAGQNIYNYVYRLVNDNKLVLTGKFTSYYLKNTDHHGEVRQDLQSSIVKTTYELADNKLTRTTEMKYAETDVDEVEKCVLTKKDVTTYLTKKK